MVAFFGSAYLGGKMAAWAVGGALLLLGSASAPVVAVASIGAFVTGGMLGSCVGKELIDGVYELYDWVVE